MSNQAQGLVRGLALKAPLKPVLMAYGAYADELGYCWAGVDTIAFDTGYSPTTVKEARRELIAAGWMASKRRFGTSSIVRLNLERMSGAQVDRGEARMIHPELEFEPETPRSSPDSRLAAVRVSAGQAQSAATRLTEACEIGVEQPRGGSLVSRVAAEYSAATRPVSVSESSDDPSVDAREPARAGGGRHRRADSGDGTATEPGEGSREGMTPPKMRPETDAPTLLALDLVAGLDFGTHRRPNRTQAWELASRVDAAIRGGLSVTEVRRYAQATVNAAKPPAQKGNAVRYLINGLAPEHLPVPHIAAGHLRGEGRIASVPESGTLPAGADSEGRRAALAAVRALPSMSPLGGSPTARPAVRRAVRAPVRPRRAVASQGDPGGRGDQATGGVSGG